MEQDKQLQKIQETLELILAELRKVNSGGADLAWMGTGEDPLYETAKALVIAAGKASASFMQRRLRVGYARAARLIDLLEEDGVIEPGDGAKPRKVLTKAKDSPKVSDIIKNYKKPENAHE
ncbi:MAG: hypothetical protein MUD10_04895 [Candidatus Pacebacteria bacterium]|jgi:S-DNA-T family DNA segregation ATPase FtsK/SpoIIIE|nr:hypothetical protein [Candidatus Paceibacterota bacterium]